MKSSFFVSGRRIDMFTQGEESLKGYLEKQNTEELKPKVWKFKKF